MAETHTDWWPLITRCYGSQRAVAEALDVSASLIGYYARGQMPPQAEWCHILSEGTGLTLHALRPDLWRHEE